MHTVALYSLKGGVGKTTAAVNLAALAAAEGRRTLLWDLDPQAAATFCFRIKSHLAGGSKGLLKHRRTLREGIKGTDIEGLDLVPADFSYRQFDLRLERTKRPRDQLARLVKPLGKDYDWLILDCPSGISLLLENVFRAADGLALPLVPAQLSLRTLEQIRAFLDADLGARAPQLLPFFSMTDGSRGRHRERMQQLAEACPELLTADIPWSEASEAVADRRAPLTTGEPPSEAGIGAAAMAYRALWQELKARLRAERSGGMSG
jgi:cellulose biosynthesis protein BcsQ